MPEVIVVNFHRFLTRGTLRRWGFVVTASVIRGAVTGEGTDMFVKGEAGPPSAWLSRSVGSGTAPTRGTTSSAEEGDVRRVGHVGTTGVVETTPRSFYFLFF